MANLDTIPYASKADTRWNTKNSDYTCQVPGTSIIKVSCEAAEREAAERLQPTMSAELNMHGQQITSGKQTDTAIPIQNWWIDATTDATKVSGKVEQDTYDLLSGLEKLLDSKEGEQQPSRSATKNAHGQQIPAGPAASVDSPVRSIHQNQRLRPNWRPYVEDDQVIDIRYQILKELNADPHMVAANLQFMIRPKNRAHRHQTISPSLLERVATVNDRWVFKNYGLKVVAMPNTSNQQNIRRATLASVDSNLSKKKRMKKSNQGQPGEKSSPTRKIPRPNEEEAASLRQEQLDELNSDPFMADHSLKFVWGSDEVPLLLRESISTKLGKKVAKLHKKWFFKGYGLQIVAVKQVPVEQLLPDTPAAGASADEAALLISEPKKTEGFSDEVIMRDISQEEDSILPIDHAHRRSQKAANRAVLMRAYRLRNANAGALIIKHALQLVELHCDPQYDSLIPNIRLPDKEDKKLRKVMDQLNQKWFFKDYSLRVVVVYQAMAPQILSGPTQVLENGTNSLIMPMPDEEDDMIVRGDSPDQGQKSSLQRVHIYGEEYIARLARAKKLEEANADQFMMDCDLEFIVQPPDTNYADFVPDVSIPGRKQNHQLKAKLKHLNRDTSFKNYGMRVVAVTKETAQQIASDAARNSINEASSPPPTPTQGAATDGEANFSNPPTQEDTPLIPSTSWPGYEFPPSPPSTNPTQLPGPKPLYSQVLRSFQPLLRLSNATPASSAPLSRTQKIRHAKEARDLRFFQEHDGVPRKRKIEFVDPRSAMAKRRICDNDQEDVSRELL
ncbi:hypothetical protein B0O99DRAFT_595845 [Bisporella sp. PMI_857]|nr:hypothetical protein B0O99DRAFT_595845 [Bisporella sp. PMI_857]